MTSLLQSASAPEVQHRLIMQCVAMPQVLRSNWFGFMDWLGGEEGFVWRELEDYDPGEAFE